MKGEIQMGNGIKLGKNIPVDYNIYIWNGKCENEEDTYNLKSWAEANDIDLDIDEYIL